MAESNADRALADALVGALESRTYGIPTLYYDAIEQIFAAVLKQHGQLPQIIPDEELRTLAANAVDQTLHGDKAPSDLFGQLKNVFHLFQPDSGAPWLSSTMINADANVPGRRRQALAHQYVLAFPESLAVLEQFAAPGRIKAEARATLVGRFVGFRKLNSMNVDLLIDALKDFKLLEQGTDHIVTRSAPAPAILALMVKRYLQLTGYKIDVGYETADLISQVTTVLPKSVVGGHPTDSVWIEKLRPVVPIFHKEVGGAQVRIKMEGLIWCAQAGLLTPVDGGQVLRLRRARESLVRIREALVKRFADAKSSPDDANDILSGLSLT
jgi:hypothetical protein